MKVRDGLRRSAVAIEPEATVERAAQVMEQAGVGALAIIDGDELTGIVTDRDLVRRALAPGLPRDARVDSVMSSPVFRIGADADLHDAFRRIRDHAVRRLAVVDDGGRFVGMLSIDDLLLELAANVEDLARPVVAELVEPHRDSPVPVNRPEGG